MPTLNLSAYELARLATKGFLATITALFQSGICKKKINIIPLKLTDHLNMENPKSCKIMKS